MGFSEKIQADALVACGRCCCICHKFCGTKIELHHIKQRANGGADSFDNCIPLCFDCHSDMGKADPKHPKGKHYSADELKLHRDAWYEKVKGQRLNVEVYTADKELFEKICSVFDEEIQVWLSKKDLRGTYPTDAFEPLRKLLYDADNPFFEFLNFELEKLRGSLFDALISFLDYLAENTFPVDNKENRIAPRVWLLEHYYMHSGEEDYEVYRAKHYKEFQEQGMHLNDLANDAWNCYCDFVRQGRRILVQ